MSYNLSKARDFEGVRFEEELPPSNNSLRLENVSSFSSFNLFKDKEFIIFNNVKTYNGTLLKGPRRVLRLCLFGLILPVFLISIPLYVRLILYPPYQVSLAPTDQRLLNSHASSIWCQSQSVHMNGSFNAYMLSEKPSMRRHFQTHHMLKHIVLKDDFKEYWGFFLLKGSVVKIDLCNRYDGGSLMIMRGADNLRKCAWITQIDSGEEGEDSNESSNESEDSPELIQETFVVEQLNFDPIGNFKGPKPLQKRPQDKTKIFTQKSPDRHSTEGYFISEERRKLLDFYVQRIIKLSKASNEITESFDKQNYSLVKKIEDLTADEIPLDEAIKSLNKGKERKSGMKINRGKSKNERMKNQPKGNQEERDRVERALNTDIPDEAKELDDDKPHEGMKILNPGNVKFERLHKPTQDELYKRIYKMPKGLEFERGTFNLSTGQQDQSNEEQRSSFSSSEEALANCEGLLGAVPLYADPMCKGFESAPANRITYRVSMTGTYYFVFSSDNEVFDSNMFFDMTLQRVVYDTTHPKETCFNQTECSLSFSFWSHDQAVIEVPEGSDWNSTYILDAKCEPRVAIYLCILILVPIVILFCALQ